jgi:hypothetical protein
MMDCISANIAKKPLIIKKIKKCSTKDFNSILQTVRVSTRLIQKNYQVTEGVLQKKIAQSLDCTLANPICQIC